MEIKAMKMLKSLKQMQGLWKVGKKITVSE